MSDEMDSFNLKFKNLWKSGRNANLTIKSTSGKAKVILSVELDEPAVHAHLQHHHHPARNGPARQRRREKRAAAREAAAAEVSESVTAVAATAEDPNATGNEVTQVVSIDTIETEEVSKVDMETGQNENEIKDLSKTFKLAEIAKEVNDEICPNSDFDDEEHDPFEATRDRMIGKALVSPVGFSTVAKDIIENEIRQKFGEIGMAGIETKRSYLG